MNCDKNKGKQCLFEHSRFCFKKFQRILYINMTATVNH